MPRDIVRRGGQRKSHFLFSFPGLLKPTAWGSSPILGARIMCCTSKNKYLTLQMTRSAKGVACEDVFESLNCTRALEDGCPGCPVSFTPLHKSIQQLEKAATKIHKEKKMLHAESWGLKTREHTLKVREINYQLMMAEGLAGRPWYKHMVSGCRYMHHRTRTTGARKHSLVSSQPSIRRRSSTRRNLGGSCSMKFTGVQGLCPRLRQSWTVD